MRVVVLQCKVGSRVTCASVTCASVTATCECADPCSTARSVVETSRTHAAVPLPRFSAHAIAPAYLQDSLGPCHGLLLCIIVDCKGKCGEVERCYGVTKERVGNRRLRACLDAWRDHSLFFVLTMMDVCRKSAGVGGAWGVGQARYVGLANAQGTALCSALRQGSPRAHMGSAAQCEHAVRSRWQGAGACVMRQEGHRTLRGQSAREVVASAGGVPTRLPRSGHVNATQKSGERRGARACNPPVQYVERCLRLPRANQPPLSS